jgi:beta-phosphoglucomutase-like phosphatase (HAD superfamily)
LASSSTRRLIDAVLDRFAFTPRFAAVASGESVTRLKPAPDIFLMAASMLGEAAGACVVLEDSRAGVEAARAAAMPVIAVPERDLEAFFALTPHVAVDLHEARAMLGL